MTTLASQQFSRLWIVVFTSIKSIKSSLGIRTPDWYVLLRGFYKAHGVLPRIIRPVTFTEKIVHRSLFDRREILTRLTDKAAARSYVEQRIGPQFLPKLYHLTSQPETIPFDELPDRFVVKPTHASGWVRLITDKSTLDRAALVETCRDWLKQSYYEKKREWVYKNVEPRILVEQYIDDGSGAVPNDYKLYVFDGTVELILLSVGRFKDHRLRFYTPAWKKLDVLLANEDIIGDAPPPANLGNMIAAAQVLSQGMDFMRVDFYDTGDRFYCGELTMTPGGGLDHFRPKQFDHYLGQCWKIRTR
jgi:TupA-like ATPgrasp